MRRDEVNYRLVLHPDDMPVRGNAMASGDEAADRACEDEILARLADGDEWAWCCVECRAEWGGFHSSAFLGGCCYRDEEEFRGGPWEDMKAEALEGLEEMLRRAGSYFEGRA